MQIKGYKQFKYTQNIWRDWFDSSFYCGKYRKYIRIAFCLPLLFFDVFRLGLTLLTITVDIYRLYKSVTLFYNHFVRHWKPYVLQRHVEYSSLKNIRSSIIF